MERADLLTALRDAQAWCAASTRALVIPELPPTVGRCSGSWLPWCKLADIDFELWDAQRTQGPPLSPANVLRTAVLAPPDLHHERDAAVSHVVERRRLLVACLERSTESKGRLLAYLPDMNLADGAAMVTSRGFFDVNNVPPWDTWVAYLRRAPSSDVVLAWVPQVLVDLAGQGIHVNPECCIGWADDHAHKDVSEELVAYGL